MTRTRKMTLSVSDKKKEIYYAGNPDIVKEYPVIGVLASGKAPGPVVWDSYHLFYALRDSDVTIAGGWHSPLEKGILDALIEGKINIALFAAKGLGRKRLILKRPFARKQKKRLQPSKTGSPNIGGFLSLRISESSVSGIMCCGK